MVVVVAAIAIDATATTVNIVLNRMVELEVECALIISSFMIWDQLLLLLLLLLDDKLFSLLALTSLAAIAFIIESLDTLPVVMLPDEECMSILGNLFILLLLLPPTPLLNIIIIYYYLFVHY